MVKRWAAWLMLAFFVTGCARPWTEAFKVTPASIWAPINARADTQVTTPTISYILPATLLPGSTLPNPTLDAPHRIPEGRQGAQTYTVQAGDMLSAIAGQFNVSLEMLMQENKITNPDVLEVGQVLAIPQVTPQPMGPAFKIIPDSELVYGPLSGSFDISAFIQSKGGYLAGFRQDVNGTSLDGAQVVELISRDYSINPRLLLALLEYRTGWLTKPNPAPVPNEMPFGYVNDWYVGLYRQLAWAGTQLNRGFYHWQDGSVSEWLLADGSVVPINPTINTGTAGVQNLFAAMDDHAQWRKDVDAQGLQAVYRDLFGDPFAAAIEPLIPADLQQPTMELPFAAGETWSFTGGPHLAWDNGTPLGALDFAPPGEALGCVESQAWVRASVDGLVIRTGDGLVVLDLDGDGNEGSGWVIDYMHVESRDRVAPGTRVHTGDALGHPSCEGGLSSGTHVHMARKFNGVWIAAYGQVPFRLSGWVATGTGETYVGTLLRAGKVVEAFEGNSGINKIQR